MATLAAGSPSARSVPFYIAAPAGVDEEQLAEMTARKVVKVIVEGQRHAAMTAGSAR